jgi:hypothetical protein
MTLRQWSVGLFGGTGRFNDPTGQGTLEDDGLVPGRYGDEVLKGSMSAAEIIGRETGGHGFHAQTLSGQADAEVAAG